MTILVGGGGGVGPTGATGPDLAGLTSDNANGVVVAGKVVAGDAAAAVLPSFHRFYGSLELDDTPANGPDGDPVLLVRQKAALAADNSAWAVALRREGTLNGHAYGNPVLGVIDNTGSYPNLQEWQNVSIVAAAIGKEGGLGLFGHVPPTTASAITGALSAVTDVAAKAVLTSIIAALIADGGATNGTT